MRNYIFLTIKQYSAPFWRLLITGANDNTKVKLWCAPANMEVFTNNQVWNILTLFVCIIRFLAAVDMG